ncbi:AI-2E family transporter [Simiduia sp. 21SJ11W-1]|uniref:AI-2E family transporter n=1 Tax=Simiduia sp. 21SJ11W-1 TaxID=2909669 RepID=UPI00209D7B8C|nr:AI-2E family transporter [Simiduia sp. 21SJ11W-1]UTA47741.1 AI-2E family transporter [Simiduia sp. 21SJ11W-1]
MNAPLPTLPPGQELIVQPARRPRKWLKPVQFYLALLATLYTLYFAKVILLPIVLAAFIALFSSPTVARLERIGVPRMLGTMGVLVTIVSGIAGAALLFTDPAQQWWHKLPEVMENLSNGVIEATQASAGSAMQDINNALNDQAQQSEFRHTTILSLLQSLASATPTVLTQILVTLFLAYFFMVYGQQLLLNWVQIKNSFSDKRRAVELIHAMQADLSTYISTITLINIALGLTVGCVFYMLGVEDPFLWGALAGALNFAPYLGPMLSATAFSLVAYLQFQSLQFALLIPAVYLCINLLESQFVTPTLLGRTLDLNPLVVFLWLVVWGWLWGGFGMLVGVPLLVCVSIYLEQTGAIGPWYRLLKQAH